MSTLRVHGLELVAGPGRTVLASNRNFLAPGSLCGYLDKNRASLERLTLSLINQINSSGRLPRGVKIVRPEIRISGGCTAEAVSRNSGISVRASLPRNIVFFNLTTPTILGQWADPRFSIDFDLTASTDIRVPATVADGLSVGPTRLTVSKIKPDSQNVTGDIALAVSQFVAALSGQDFIGALTRDRSFEFDEIGYSLGDFSKALGAQRGPYIVSFLDPSTHILMLHVTDRLPQGPVVR